MNRFADASKVSARDFARHTLGPTPEEIAADLAAIPDAELDTLYARALKEKDATVIKLLFGEKFRRACVEWKADRRAA